MANTHYLIVEQSPQPPAALPELLKRLAADFRLDMYQCRQRLIGKGLSLLAKGPRETLENIAHVLAETAIPHWITSPTKPTFAPPRIKGITGSDSGLTFTCHDKSVTLVKGARVLAVFADLSGELAEKSVKHLLTSHAYRGRDHIEHLEDEKIFQTILQGRPVLDLYCLDETGAITDGVRIFPGKFDPRGLGERATLSSKQNLKAILELVRDVYAGEFILWTEFGLANLPGCQLHRDNPPTPETLRRNLISLTRYGWLMADIGQADRHAKDNQSPAGQALAATLLQTPVLAAGEVAPEVQPIIDELNHAVESEEQTVSGRSPRPAHGPKQGLPSPPPGVTRQRWNTPAFWFGTAGSVVVGLLIALLEIDNSHTLRHLLSQAFASGALPFLFGLLMFWYGFYFLRLKRQIENTPTSRIRSIAMGMVEVKGRAIRKYALVSPMTHVACAYYRLTRYRRGKNNKWEVSSITSSHHVPFLLEDDTGRIEIDPTGCRVNAGNRQEGMPGQVGLFHVDTDSHEKWVEETILEGTLLYVLGYASVRRATGPTLNERKHKALRELKQNGQLLKRYDQDGDGQISAEEWDTARADVEEQILRESLTDHQERKKQEEHVVIGKQKGRPLIISETHSEEHLTARYLTYSLPLFVIAALATGFSIYLLVQYLN